MLLLKPIKYFVLALLVSASFLLVIGFSTVFGSFKDADISIVDLVKDDLTPEQDENLKAIVSEKMSSLSASIVNFFAPKTKYSDFFEKADLVYEPTEWVPLTEQDILDSVKKGEQMQSDAFNKALDEAMNFDNTTLKDARDKGIENAGGVE